MTQFVALHPQHHQALRVDPQKIEAVGAQERMVPVVLSEFLKLVVDYPIVLTKNEETGQFVCVALTGFFDKENLFWENDSWQSIYVPLNIQRQPFFIGQENDKVVVCLDAQSPCLSQTQGDALFTERGEETLFLQKAKAILADLVNSQARTGEFVQALLGLKLIVPMALDITFANGEQTRVQGVYTIDEKRLNELTSEELLGLQQQQFLQPIYTMLASLGQIYSLINKKNARLQAQ